MTNSPAITRGRRALHVVLSLAAVLLVSTFVAPGAAHADDTIGISARPAGADGAPDARTRFSYREDPGQHVADRFLVKNTGADVQQFTVVGRDAFNDDDGRFALLDTAQEPTAIGRWIRFENGKNRITFTLAPGKSRLLPFSLDLPADATPGDHVGGLVASVVQKGAQVNVDRRVATRMYARVSGELHPQLTIGSIDASYDGAWWNLLSGSVTLRYTVDNTGNIALASNVTSGVKTWFGIPAAGAKGGSIQEVLPGDSAAYEFTVPAIAQLLYVNPYLTLNPFVDDPDTAKQLPVQPTTRDAVVWAVPWSIVIVLLVAGAVALGLWWRKRRDAARLSAWLDYTQAQARAEAQRDAGLVSSRSGEGSTDG